MPCQECKSVPCFKGSKLLRAGECMLNCVQACSRLGVCALAKCIRVLSCLTTHMPTEHTTKHFATSLSRPINGSNKSCDKQFLINIETSWKVEITFRDLDQPLPFQRRNCRTDTARTAAPSH